VTVTALTPFRKDSLLGGNLTSSQVSRQHS
jgi:hypothetical protein